MSGDYVNIPPLERKMKTDNGLAEPKPQFGCCPDLVCSTTKRRRQTPVQYGLVWRPGPLLRFYGWRIKGGDGETAPTAPVSGRWGRSEVVSPGVVIRYPDSVIIGV